MVENKKKKNYDQYNKYQKRIRKERKQKLVEMFGGKCQTCAYKALDFHHVDSEGKEFSLSNLGYTCRWERLVEEAKKCTLLCANCHRELDD